MADIFLTDKDRAQLETLIGTKANLEALNALAGVVDTKSSKEALTNLGKSLAATLDTAINSLSRFEVVSYQGTGDSGYESGFYTVIPFNIKPEIVLVMKRGASGSHHGNDVPVGGQIGFFFYGYSSEAESNLNVEWTENSLRLYSTNSEKAAHSQYNTAGETYYAIGFEMKEG